MKNYIHLFFINWFISINIKICEAYMKALLEAINNRIVKALNE